jgi:tetratricopeptide (TPR) repeat protein
MRLLTARLAAALACNLIVAGSMVPGAVALQDPDWLACNDNKDHDHSIAGCTHIIDRGNREPAAARALAHRNRADAYYRKGDNDRAILDAGEAIALDPQLAAAYNTRGHVYLSKHDYDRAIADYDEAIRRDPKFAMYYVNRAFAHYGRGDSDLAIRDAEAAIGINPKLANAYAARGYANLGKHNADQAMRDADQAVRLDPKQARGYDLRGNVYLEKRLYDRAIQEFDAAIKLDPVDPRAYVGHGAAYREKGDLRRAMVELDASIRLNPNLPRAYFHRGLVHARNGDQGRAMADLRRAIELERNGAFTLEAREALAKVVTASVAPAPPAPPAPTPPRPAPVLAAVPAAAQHRTALVIGNSSYKAVAALPNPRRDAEAVAAALRGIGFEVTLAGDLARDKLVDALRSFAAASEKADWAVIYFAGHGIEVGGVNYLVPVDARLAADRDVQFEAVPLDQVLGAVEGAHKLRMVLLDACRENPFARQMQRTVAARSVGRGLARIEPGPGTLVAYAARDGQVALDGDGQNSPFAAALVKLLNRPGLEINKLFRLVHDEVMEATGNRQEPYTYGALPGREDFYFVSR